MSIAPELNQAVNDQINIEFQSAYVYLAMSAWFTENNLPGFAQWMMAQWEEETGHALKLYRFLHDRGGSAQLQQINEPKIEAKTALDIFTDVRNHEQMVTQKINDLYELAVSKKDLPLQVVLQWYINEQVEEEATVEEIVDRLKLIGSDGPAIYLLDREMGSRNATKIGGEDQ